MKVLGKKTAYEGKHFRVVDIDYLAKSGKRAVWEAIEQKIYKRNVIIFALTPKKEVILERVFRVPLNGFVFELPAGRTDKKGEKEMEAARRELLEETGYFAEKLIPIFWGPSGAGLQNSELIFFFAPDVKFVGKRQNKKEGEEIKVVRIPLKKLVSFIIKNFRKEKIDPGVLSILPILKEKKLIC